MKLLFLGNSATYVHDIPGTLAALAAELGIAFETAQITPGGCELAMHANPDTDLGQRVLAAIGAGHDRVILQDNGSCITTPEKRQAASDACHTLADAVRQSGASLCFYIRPPYGKPLNGLSPFDQCRAFDELFAPLADQLDALRIPVNRAFALAIRTLDFPLWGPDNGHTSPHGAYLATCTFFAALTGQSATQLAPHTLPAEEAEELAKIADRVTLEGIIPW